MTHPDLHQRARRAIFRNAIFSPQSLSILMIVLFGVLLDISFLGASSQLWLAFGLIAEVLYLGATFTDPSAASHAVSQMFRRDFNPGEIKNPHARQRLEQALEYYQQMQRLASLASGARRVQFDSTVSQIDDWIEQIFRIARRIDSYEENEIIRRDRLRVPNDLNVMRQRLASEPDESIQREIHDAVNLKEEQLHNLQEMERYVKRANAQLDTTLTALGTIFTQLQLMDSRSIDGARASRLKAKINEEVTSLRDTIDTIDDVQASSIYRLSAYES